MHPRRRLATLGAAVLAAATAASLAVTAPVSAVGKAHPAPGTLYELRVPVRTTVNADAELLQRSGFDLLEERAPGALFVLGDDAVRTRLGGLGFASAVARTYGPARWQPPKRASVRADGTRTPADDTYYGGYPTVTGQYAHLDQVASAHADLATVVTYGQSWAKSQGQGGYDLKAICITHKSAGDCDLKPTAPKPRFVLMGQIHAREIATGAIAYRWIDYLVNGYNTDANVTALLNSTELWVIPVANPDGVDIVQQGGDNPYLQRKNADSANSGSCQNPPGQNNQIGVDLNRNAGYQWNTGGSSDEPCDETYHGPSADSEPENTATEALFRQLFAVTRDSSSPTNPASADSKGLFITMHSNSKMVILPWAWTTDHTGNDAQLRAIAGQFGQDTGYQVGQAPEILYAASGGTDDWAYGQLGTASFTIEVGDAQDQSCDGFTPPYSCIDSYYWNNMRQALLDAAKYAPAPYKSGQGPNVASLSAVGAALTASLAPAGRGPNQPAPAAAVAAARSTHAEYSLDVPFGAAGARPAAMTVTAGRRASATVPTAGLAPGRHLVYVRAQDAAGHWGPASATWLTIGR